MLKRIDILAIALAIAALYVTALLGFQIRHGAADWAASQNLNLLGDSVGGLTAPLALIFLIAAVIIQRQELALTKEELKKSAEALDSQVIEQRQHREFVGQQTEMMRREAEASAENTRKAYKLSLFDKRYAIYFELDDIRQKIQASNPNWRGLYDQLSDLNNRSRFLFGDDVNHWFTWFCGEVRSARETAIKLENMDTGRWNSGGSWIPTRSEEVVNAEQHLDNAHKLVLTNLSHDVLYKVFAESMEVTD